MSTAAEDKKYTLAIVIVLGGIFVLAILLVLVAMQVVGLLQRTTAAGPHFRVATAYLGILGDFTNDFSVSTVVDVRLPRGIYSEPSLQLTAIAPLERHSWEAGLIRAKKYGYRLAPYVSESSQRARYKLLYLPPISDGPHRIELQRSGTTLRFCVDGRPVYTFVHGPALPDSRLRLAVATAVGRPGEVASGSFWDLRIHEHGRASNIYHGVGCSVSFGGVAFVPKGSRWIFEGVSDPAQLDRRTRHCRSSS